MTASWSLSLELAGHFGGPFVYECAATSVGGWASLGAMFRPFGARAEGAARGFFISPKLIGHLARAQGTSPGSDFCPATPYPDFLQYDVTVGASIGWETVLSGHLSVGSALGASIGLGRTTAPALRVATVGAVDVVWQLDVSLLRIGYAW